MKKCVEKARLHVETLECRAQPGSMLSLAGSLLGAAALDLNARSDDNTQAHETVIVQHNLARDNDLALHVRYNGTDGASAHETAPVRQQAVTSAPVQTNAQSGLSIQDQARSVSQAHVAQAVAASQPAYTLGQGSVVAPGTGFNQASTPAHTAGLAVSAEALAMDHVVAAAPTRVSAQLGVHLVSAADLNLTVTHYTFSNHLPPPPNATTIYDSYVGTGAPDFSGFFGDKVTATRGQLDGSNWITGFVTDPSTGLHDLLVGQIDPNGFTINAVTLADSSGASDLQSNGIDISPTDGAIYVAGTFSAPGTLATPQSLPLGQLVILRIEPDLSAVDWGLIGNPDLQTQANGLRINEDPNLGESVLATGGLINTSTGLSNVGLISISGLSSDPSTEVINGGFYNFGDPRTGGAGNTVGLSIVGDPYTGYTYAVGSLGQGTASTAFLAVSGIGGDFTTAGGIYLNAAAPNGAWTSVDVDPFTGSIYLDGTFLNSGHQSLLVSAFSFDGSTFTSVYTNGGQQIGGWLWTVTLGGVPIDWYGTGNAVIPDGSGDQATLGTGNDPSNPGGIILLFRLGPNGDTPLDASFPVIGGGSLDDWTTGLSVVQDPNPNFGYDYYSGGYTNSPDFATTPQSFEPNDPDPTQTLYEGWVDATVFS